MTIETSATKERIINMNLGMKPAAKLFEEVAEKKRLYKSQALIFVESLGGDYLPRAIPGCSFEYSTTDHAPNLYVNLPDGTVKNGIRKVLIIRTGDGMCNVEFSKRQMLSLKYWQEQTTLFRAIRDIDLMQLFRSETGLAPHIKP